MQKGFLLTHIFFICKCVMYFYALDFAYREK